mmetsp:Transcript_112332/g.204451  ORF Transcript_112332/g.204451 Transcript_112332/m.204451 type:complete len:790 (-) Transcript_112332:34-2403(-)
MGSLRGFALPVVLLVSICHHSCFTSAEKHIELDGPQYACDNERQEVSQRIRGRLNQKLPSFAGRVPFAVVPSDLDFLEQMHQDAAQLDAENVLLTRDKLKAPESWSVCALGMLTLRVTALLLKVAETAAEVLQAVAELAPLVLAAPWVDILLHGWPLLTAYAVLVRWTAPHGGQSPQESPVEASFGLECDASEHGATHAARRLLSNVWRSRDPLILEGGGVVLAELALAKIGKEMEGTTWGGNAGTCHWTEHAGRYLGGLVDAAEPENSDLLSAMAACDHMPSCAGVTAEPNFEASGSMKFTLRTGKPFLDESPVGETSYVKWCHASASSVKGCPFGQSTGLLATAVRQLRSAALADFAPELVIEAQALAAEWAAHVGPESAGVEAWATEWPLWDVLGHLQQRVDLTQSHAGGGGDSPQAPWQISLQHALAFDDESWRLTMAELEEIGNKSIHAVEDSQHLKGSIPLTMRQIVRCASGKQCVAEFFARLHLLLYSSETLPLRDPIFMTTEDVLSGHFMERGKALSRGRDDDWDTLTSKEARATSTATLAEELDQFMPSAHPLQVDRRQLAYFVRESRKLLAERPLGRCLEWDQPFLVVRGFQGVCRWSDVFSYSEPDPDDPYMGLPGRHEYTYGTRHYWGDLMSKDGLGIEPDTFDLIMVPFVFEHVAQPFRAMRNLAYVLRSGGYIIWAAPMFQHYHGSPHDYFRYTPKGARALAADAGLEVVWLYAPGDLSLVSGVMMGMLLPYWSEEQMLAEAPLVNDEDCPRHPLNVFMLLRKPPLTSQTDQTPQ